MGDELSQRTQFLGINRVGPMNNHTRHSLENCLRNATLRKRFPWSDCVGCIYERKHLAGTDCVGCTYDRKWFRLYNWIFLSSTVCITVFACSPVAHDLILPSMCARRAYPRRFVGRVERAPYRSHSLGDGSERRHGKGLKTICIAPCCTSVYHKIWKCRNN